MADEPAQQSGSTNESVLVAPASTPPPVIVTPQGPLAGDPGGVMVQYAVSTEVSSSPFPPPALLKQYKEMLGQDAAERIMVMVEREGDHRRALEVKQVDAEIADVYAQRLEQRWGQLLGFGIGVIALIAGAVVAICAPPVTGSIAGSIIGGSGVAGLVTVFVLGRRHKATAEVETKDKPKAS